MAFLVRSKWRSTVVHIVLHVQMPAACMVGSQERSAIKEHKSDYLTHSLLGKNIIFTLIAAHFNQALAGI